MKLFVLICVFLAMLVLPAEMSSAAAGVDSTTFPAIVERIKHSLALVRVKTNIDSVFICGTAFVIHKRGIMATCAHVVFDTKVIAEDCTLRTDTSDITLEFHANSQVCKARVIGVRPDKDIAILEIVSDSVSGLTCPLYPIVPGPSIKLQEGDDVACTGYDLIQQQERSGRIYNRLTTHRGIVSSMFWIDVDDSRRLLEQFQMDALVNEGASGAPVYRADNGAVIGMISSFKGLAVEGSVIKVNYGIANCVAFTYILNLYESCVPSLRP